MKRLSTIVGLMLLCATPANAQLLPGRDADVYTADGGYVGHYVGKERYDGSAPSHLVMMEVDGDSAALSFKGTGWTTGWLATLHFADSDCTGAAHVAQDADEYLLPSASGHYYAIWDGRLYRWRKEPSTASVLSELAPDTGLYSNRAVPGGPYTFMNAVEYVMDMPAYSFPFHLRPSSLHAPAVPIPAILVGVLGIAAIAARRLTGRTR